MTKILHFRRPDPRGQQAVREEAAAWLARLDAAPGEGVPDELVDWLRQDRRHLVVMLEMATLWDQFTLLEELSDIFPLGDYGIGQERAKPSRRWWSIGAAVTLCLLAVMLPVLFTGESQAPTATVYSTLIGEQESVTLSDGSQVMLNTNTAIEVNYRPDDRAIELLRGEALFQVAHAPARPFRVTAGNRVVEAVGTAFTVQHDERGNNLEVMVTEGEVLLQRYLPLTLPPGSSAKADRHTAQPAESAGHAGVSLRAGQLVTVDESLDEVIQQEVAAEEMQVRLSWQHGMLLFRNEPLQDVLDEVARYTTTIIEADASVRDIRVEGYFRVGDIDGLLHAMQSNFSIDVQRPDVDHIYLSAQ